MLVAPGQMELGCCPSQALPTPALNSWRAKKRQFTADEGDSCISMERKLQTMQTKQETHHSWTHPLLHPTDLETSATGPDNEDGGSGAGGRGGIEEGQGAALGSNRLPAHSLHEGTFP